MKVKVECPCGLRFEFEVEPVNGRMPVGLNCPACGSNATDLANAIIAQQLGHAAPAIVGVPAPVPAAKSVPIRIGAPAPAAAPATAPAAPTPPPGGGLRISKTHSAPPAPAPTAASVPTAPAAVHAPQPVMTSEERRHMVAESARRKRDAEERPYMLARNITVAALALGVVVFGLWGWYAWFARDPKVVYTMQIPVPNKELERHYKPEGYYDLIAPGQLLSVKSKQAGLFDITKQTQVWTTPLQTADETAAAKAGKNKKSAASADDPDVVSDDEYTFVDPKVVVTSNDVWMAFGDRLLRLDRATGTRKEPTVMGRIMNFSSDDDALMLIYLKDGQKTLARISLTDGTIQTASLSTTTNSAPTNAPKQGNLAIAKTQVLNANENAMAGGGKHRHGNNDKFVAAGAGVTRGLKTQMPGSDAADAAALAAASPPVDEGDYSLDEFEGYNHPFMLAGQNVVQFSSKVLEKKIATHEAVRAKKGPSVLDSGNVTASQGLDLAQEMISDSTREATGGVEQEDVSRYQVTLHRWFAEDAPDWTGEVIGPPNVYPLKTVDLLIAGQTLIVFDKHNKKMWEGKLTYASHSFEDRPAFLENGDALYVADPGGMTRFDLATGNVRWRMDSVGISAIHADVRGNVYVSSTDASADHISHPHEVNIHDKIHPLLLKLDASTGKVLWSQASVGDKCFFSGKFLYATLMATLQSPLKLETGPDVHFNLRLLDPSNGRQIWEYQKINDPLIKTQVQKNWIMLQFEDGVTVMKFFSL